jgi:hypothetical protein
MVEKAENLKKEIISLSTEGFNPLKKSGQTHRSAPTKNYEIKTPEKIFKLSQQNKNNLYVVF